MDPTATSPLFNVPFNPSVLRDATRMASRGVDYANRDLGADKYVEKDNKHKGVGGAARGILGFLGDLLLTRLHMPALFSQGEEKRKLAAAQEGFDIDPESAINRVASIDPERGFKLRENYTDNKRIEAANAATREAAQNRYALAKEASDQKIRLGATSMLGSMEKESPEKQKAMWPAVRAQILYGSSRRGLDLSDELPEEYDPVAIETFKMGGIPLGTQHSQALTGRRIDEGIRHNGVTEDQGQQKVNESLRHNKETEGLGQGNLGEKVRHNGETEKQGDQKIGLQSGKLAEDIKHHRNTEANTTPGQNLKHPIRLQVINGKTYKFELSGKDWVNLGEVK